MRIPRSTEYAMNARPISAPAPMMGMMQTTYSPAPTQLSPYMQELMRNYMAPTVPTIPQAPDNFTQPVVQPMPTETPLSPYMQQLLQNYRVQNILGQYSPQSPMDYLRTYNSGGMITQ